MSAERYDNPETKQKLDEARKELQRQEQAEQAQEAADVISARSTIAEEEQPDPDEPVDLRETYTVGFRGHDFEFFELGDASIKAAQFASEEEDEVEAGTRAAAFVYETMGDKAVDDRYDEAYWRRYDFTAVMELFEDLADEATDMSEVEREKIEEFRNE